MHMRGSREHDGDRSSVPTLAPPLTRDPHPPLHTDTAHLAHPGPSNTSQSTAQGCQHRQRVPSPLDSDRQSSGHSSPRLSTVLAQGGQGAWTPLTASGLSQRLAGTGGDRVASWSSVPLAPPAVRVGTCIRPTLFLIVLRIPGAGMCCSLVASKARDTRGAVRTPHVHLSIHTYWDMQVLLVGRRGVS